jgi:MFS family permease
MSVAKSPSETIQGSNGSPVLAATRPHIRSGALSVALIVVAGAIFFAALTPPIISMSIRVLGLDPGGKTIGLSTILLIGSILSVIGSPFFGSLSDRTRNRFGRRKPWLVGGAGLMLVGGFVTGYATNIAVVAVGCSALVRRFPASSH